MYTKYAINKKLPRELLPGDSLSYEIMTPSYLLTFIWKYVFLNKWDAFWDFLIFLFADVRLKMSDFNLVK